MKECFKLALKGKGYVSPNPLVGAVVVKNDKLIGKGYHKYFGGPHAEVIALKEAGKNAKNSTLYVNLEPCSHFGKTPPCTDLIISCGVKEVVIAMKDPNPLVCGKGIKRLKKSGINIITGILNQEAALINEIFIKNISKGLPFVALKIAQTIDGRIADPSGNSKWITSPESRKYVHRLRSEYDAVLVGANTVNIDNPKLNVRLWKGRSPKVVILDGRLNVNPKSEIFSGNQIRDIFVITAKSTYNKKKKDVSRLERLGVTVIAINSKDGMIPIITVLNKISKLNIASVLVEGGTEIFSQFLESGYSDKLFVFSAPKILGSGNNSISFKKNRLIINCINLRDVLYRQLDDDILMESYLNY